jgi:hypothetical protein
LGPFDIGLNELAPVHRWAASGRDQRRLRRLTKMRKDLFDRAWLGHEPDGLVVEASSDG